MDQRRYDTRQEMLTQHAQCKKKGHAESAFHDACRTSSVHGQAGCMVLNLLMSVQL